MRSPAYLLVLAACAAKGPVPSAPVEDPGSAAPQLSHPARVAGDEPLPAGIYYRHHVYRACQYLEDVAEDAPICTTPSHVVVAGIHEKPSAAEAMLEKAEGWGLTPGYPFVAHTEELGTRGSETGIAVVLGQFASQRSAETLQRALAHRTADVVGLLPSEEAAQRLHQGEPRFLAAKVVRDTPLYASAVITGPEDEPIHLPPDQTEDDTKDEPQTDVLCTVPAGTVILLDYDGFQGGFYRWATAQCANGSKGWVAWKDTTLGVTVWKNGDHYEAIRVAGAECDSPWFETWTYDAETHAAPQVATLADRGGGCGG